MFGKRNETSLAAKPPAAAKPAAADAPPRVVPAAAGFTPLQSAPQPSKPVARARTAARAQDN